MITPKVFLYSCWCAIISMEVVVTFQFVLGAILITPEMVIAMNRSPEWMQSVGSIIAMLTPEPFATAMCGTMILATCLAFFWVYDYGRSGGTVMPFNAQGKPCGTGWVV